MKLPLAFVLLFITSICHAYVPRPASFQSDVVINLTDDKIYIFDRMDNKYEITPSCSFSSIPTEGELKVYFTGSRLTKSPIIIQSVEQGSKRAIINRCKVVSVSRAG